MVVGQRPYPLLHDERVGKMTPILKTHYWRCHICGRKGQSYHPMVAFYDHYLHKHYQEVGSTGSISRNG